MVESTTRMQERVEQRWQEMSQAAGKNLESVATWIETTRRVWLDLAQLSTAMARENLRFMMAFQSNALEIAVLPVVGWSEVQKGLTSWCEKTLQGGIATIQRPGSALSGSEPRESEPRGSEPRGSEPRGSEPRGGGRGKDVSRTQLRTQWPQLRGKLRQQWGKLTDEEVEHVQGNLDTLIARLREHYGWTRDQAEQEVDRWLDQQKFAKVS